MITILDNGYSTHEYFRNFSVEETEEFTREYEELIKKYPIDLQDGIIKQ